MSSWSQLKGQKQKPCLLTEHVLYTPLSARRTWVAILTCKGVLDFSVRNLSYLIFERFNFPET